MESFSINGFVEADYVYNALSEQLIHRLTQGRVKVLLMFGPSGNRIAEYLVDSTLSLKRIWHDGVSVLVVDGPDGCDLFVPTNHNGRPVFATDDTGVHVWEAT